MAWTKVVDANGQEIAVNLAHVVTIEPLTNSKNQRIAARLRTTMIDKDGSSVFLDLQSPLEALIRAAFN
jgi:hypothetical protein